MCCHFSHRNLCEDVEQNGEDREVDPDPLSSEALSHVLWHGVDPGDHVYGQEEPAKHHQVERGLRGKVAFQWISSHT